MLLRIPRMLCLALRGDSANVLKAVKEANAVASFQQQP